MKRFLCLFTLFLLLFCIPVVGEPSPRDLSPAIPIIRNRTKLYKHGLTETTLRFSEEEFERLLGEGATHFTVTSLPTCGTLQLNGLEISVGQSLPICDAEDLCFLPGSKGEIETAFFFKSAAAPENESLECQIRLNGSEGNFSGENKTLSTYRDTAMEIRLTDASSDQQTVIISSPKNGLLTQREHGILYYYPKTAFEGQDCFTYRILDPSGALSEPLEVNIRIEKPYQDVFFYDMKDSPYHCAAIDFVKYTDFPISKDANGRYLFEQDALISLSEVKEMVASILEREQYYQEVFEGEGTELTEAILNEIVCDKNEQTTRLEAAMAISKALIQTKEAEQGLLERIMQWFS